MPDSFFAKTVLLRPRAEGKRLAAGEIIASF